MDDGTRVRLAIVIPVYNDWASLCALIPMLDRALAECGATVTIVAVDDGSTHAFDLNDRFDLREYGSIVSVEILHLVTNVGHQRAIAIGVSEAVLRETFSHVMIMDSDGEDRPQDATLLVQAARDEPAESPMLAFVAQRRRRSEGVLFRISYFAYKVLFRGLCGKTIDFGNFSLLRVSTARHIVNMPETWNHFAASLVKAHIPLRRVPTTRGQRIAGRSKMNLVSLVTLGLSAISVYSDVLFVRTLLAALALSAAAVLGICLVIAIRLLTPLAIPGWATSAAGFLAVILAQGLTLSAMASFLTLNARSGMFTIPARDAGRFIDRREIVSVGASIGAI